MDLDYDNNNLVKIKQLVKQRDYTYHQKTNHLAIITTKLKGKKLTLVTNSHRR